MAQADGVVANGTGAAVRADLNDQLAAVFTNHSGSSEPATTYAYQWWADTTANVLKIRNSANNAWITLRELDGTLLMEDGSNSAPGLSFASDTNTGFFSGGADKIGFATGGVERLEIGSSEVVFNDPSNDVDFRVESNGNTHMLFVDAGNDRIGVGTSSPSYNLVVSNSGASGIEFGPAFSGTANLIQHYNRSGAAYVDAVNEAAQHRFQISGSEKARIDSSGRLLVGTSSTSAFDNHPSATVPVTTTENASRGSVASISHNNASTSSGGFLLGRSRGGSVGSRTIVQSGDDLGRLSFQGADGGTEFVEAAEIRAQVDGTPGTADMPGRIILATTADGAGSPTERMRIDSSGNVGIGTTSPDSLLTLDASSNPTINIKTSGTKRASLIADTGNSYALLGSFDGYPLVFSSSAGGGTTERMRIDTSGRLLVGTSSSPAGVGGYGRLSPLVVQGYTGASTAGGYMSLQRGETASGISSGDEIGILNFNESDGFTFAQIRCNADGTAGSSDYPGRLSFFTTADGASSPTERMRITSAGNIRFGQTTTDSPGFGNTTTGISMLPDGRIFSSMGSTFSQFNRNSDGGVVNFARSSTGVGVISVTTTSTSYGTSSDYRLKENVVALDGAIARVKQLLPKRFNFIVDADTTVDGFLAHEAQTVVPEAVTGTHDEVDDDSNPVYQCIDQSKLVPLLTAALQEAIAKIETLETKVAALEAG